MSTCKIYLSFTERDCLNLTDHGTKALLVLEDVGRGNIKDLILGEISIELSQYSDPNHYTYPRSYYRTIFDLEKNNFIYFVEANRDMFDFRSIAFFEAQAKTFESNHVGDIRASFSYGKCFLYKMIEEDGFVVGKDFMTIRQVVLEAGKIKLKGYVGGLKEVSLIFGAGGNSLRAEIEW